MSAEREKLFESLFEIAENYNIPLTNNPDMHRELPSAGDFCGDVESAVLAAGYRRPRTVTTVEELDALPVGAVVVDAYAAKCVLVDADRDHLSWRRATTAVHGGEHRHKPYLPATVLHEGSADV